MPPKTSILCVYFYCTLFIYGSCLIYQFLACMMAYTYNTSFNEMNTMYYTQFLFV